MGSSKLLDLTSNIQKQTGVAKQFFSSFWSKVNKTQTTIEELGASSDERVLTSMIDKLQTLHKTVDPVLKNVADVLKRAEEKTEAVTGQRRVFDQML